MKKILSLSAFLWFNISSSYTQVQIIGHGYTDGTYTSQVLAEVADFNELHSPNLWKGLVPAGVDEVTILDEHEAVTYQVGDLDLFMQPQVLSENDILSTELDTFTDTELPVTFWVVYNEDIPIQAGITDDEWRNYYLPRLIDYQDSSYLHSGIANPNRSIVIDRVESLPGIEFPGSCSVQNNINALANPNDGFLDAYQTTKTCEGMQIIVIIPKIGCGGSAHGAASQKKWDNFTLTHVKSARLVVKPERILGINNNVNPGEPWKTFSHELGHSLGSNHLNSVDPISRPFIQSDGTETYMDLNEDGTNTKWILSNDSTQYLGYATWTDGEANNALLHRYMRTKYNEFIPRFTISAFSSTGSYDLCANESIQLLATSAYDDVTYQWQGQGFDNTEISDPVVGGLNPGVYSYTVTITRACGSWREALVELTVHPSYFSEVYDTLTISETYTLPDGQTVDIGGDYTTYLTSQWGCDSTIVTHLELSTSADDPSLIEKSIHPNPTTGKVTVSNFDDIQEVRVYSITGELMMSRYKESTINLSDLIGGVYLIQVITDDGFYWGRVSKL